ncbi:hypothetical protein P8C59_000813 [Phyllachora maydis]|uniref:ATPase synthesis protein 25 n=1 Tax=Phyllachora maydis TaxID=1825666 RepID=A0AAD9HY16_9PEZI|nr:hypothetical protein P8C59_000813 [Phyllachora maydis]
MAAACSSCRLSALRLFVGNTIVPLRSVPPPFARQLGTFRPTAARQTGPALEARRGDVPDPRAEEELPWYLRVEAPRHPTLVRDEAPLPEAPAGTPAVLGPLIRYVGEELGLDAVELLDLRALEPQAALGPALVMLLGTGRSERHLHVSADRLVRWLRGRGVVAAADGLLGRNELKTRLRRKARKEKLLGNDGNAAAARRRHADDGLSTDWICVNLGTVGSVHVETSVLDDEGRTVGFGAHTGGTTMVVQMLTESKREQLGLEKLWSGRLRRSRATPGADTVGPTHGASGHRAFSTSARRPRPVDQAGPDWGSHGDAAQYQDLAQIKARITTMSLEAALSALMHGPENKLMGCWLGIVRRLPPREALYEQLWMKATMGNRGLGHIGYDLAGLCELVQAMQDEAVALSRAEYTGLLQAIFAQSGTEDGDLVRHQAAAAMRVIDTMSERGLEVLDHDVMVAVMTGLLQGGLVGAEAPRLLDVFEHLLATADLPCPSERQLLRLVDAYADAGRWDRVWDVWRIPPRHGAARTPAMYAHLLRRVAADGHQARCIDAVRWCTAEMANERPAVPAVGSVRDALVACLRVADPRAEAVARQLVVANSPRAAVLRNQEFVRLFRELGPKP